MRGMKIIFGLILGMCFACASNGQILLGTDIAVKLTVEAENPQLKESIAKDLSKQLYALNRDIVIVGGEGTFLVKVQVIEIKSSEKLSPDYVLSTIITTNEYAASRHNKPAELIDRLLGDSLLLVTEDQLKEQLKQIAIFAEAKIKMGNDSKYLRAQHLLNKDEFLTSSRSNVYSYQTQENITD